MPMFSHTKGLDLNIGAGSVVPTSLSQSHSVTERERWPSSLNFLTGIVPELCNRFFVLFHTEIEKASRTIYIKDSQASE